MNRYEYELSYNTAVTKVYWTERDDELIYKDDDNTFVYWGVTRVKGGWLPPTETRWYQTTYTDEFQADLCEIYYINEWLEGGLNDLRDHWGEDKFIQVEKEALALREKAYEYREANKYVYDDKYRCGIEYIEAV